MILGIDIGGTAIKIGIVNNYSVTKKKVYLINKKDPFKVLIESINDYIFTYRISPEAFGIASAGRVDSTTGKIVYATDNLKGWNGLELGKEISKIFSLPVFVLNDARAGGLAESKIRGVKDLVFLTVGTGLGGGVVLNGKIVIGNRWEAGELGHTILYPDGKECNCGKKGCAEKYISMRFLHECCGINDRNELLVRADEGDFKVLDCIKNLSKHLAILIDRIFLEVDPEFVVVGGGFSELGEIALKLLREEVNKYSQYSLYSPSQVHLSLIQNDASIVGAVIYAEERLKGAKS